VKQEKLQHPPAYTPTATIGILVTQAGSKMAVIIIAGFLPMFFPAGTAGKGDRRN